MKKQVFAFLFVGAMLTGGCDNLTSAEKKNLTDSSSKNKTQADGTQSFETISEKEAFQMIVRYRFNSVKIKKDKEPDSNDKQLVVYKNKATLWAEFDINSIIAAHSDIINFRVLTGAFTKDGSRGKKNQPTLILRIVRSVIKDGTRQEVTSYVISSDEDVCPEPIGCNMSIPEEEPAD